MMVATMTKRQLSREMWVIICTLAALLAFVIYAALNWYEIVDKDRWVDAKGEAVTNPYLALEKFIIASGATAERSTKSSELDLLLQIAPVSSQNTARILLLGDRRLAEMRPERVKKIIEWVQAGGRLIVEAEQPYLNDPLLDVWGIDRAKITWRNGALCEQPVKRSPRTTPTDAASTLPQRQQVTVDGMDANVGDDAEKSGSDARKARTNKENVGSIPVCAEDAPDTNDVQGITPGWPPPQSQAPRFVTLGDNTKFRVRFMPYQNLRLGTPIHDIATLTVAPSERKLITDRQGGRVVEFSEGQGRVTVVSNFDFMTYRYLREHDGAELIWHLLTRDGADKPHVVLAIYRQGEGLWKWLADHAMMVVISALAMLLFWLWHIVPRFGSLVTSGVAVRRSFTTHIVASAVFLQKRGQWMAMITPLRETVMSELRRRHPRVAAMSDVDKVRYLANLLALDEDRITRLMLIPISSHSEALAAIAELRTVRAHIAHGVAKTSVSSTP
jgi:hypothetical protein